MPYIPDNETTIRDWFAIHCPDGEIEKITVGDVRKRFNIPTEGSLRESMGTDAQWQQMRCEARYRYADAMLKARGAR